MPAGGLPLAASADPLSSSCIADVGATPERAASSSHAARLPFGSRRGGAWRDLRLSLSLSLARLLVVLRDLEAGHRRSCICHGWVIRVSVGSSAYVKRRERGCERCAACPLRLWGHVEFGIEEDNFAELSSEHGRIHSAYFTPAPQHSELCHTPETRILATTPPTSNQQGIRFSQPTKCLPQIQGRT